MELARFHRGLLLALRENGAVPSSEQPPRSQFEEV